MSQRRLIDAVLAEGFCHDRDQARQLILAGGIHVNSHPAKQPSAFVRRDALLSHVDTRQPVSRAGQKLSCALTEWRISVDGKVAADIGAAAGGFTECMLERGAVRVYAIERGKGQLAWKLRQDARVFVMEGTSILDGPVLPESVMLATIDVSWTSLKLALPHVVPLLAPGADVITLIKPNYELQDTDRLVQGVLVDESLRNSVVEGVLAWMTANGWQVHATMVSQIAGEGGNVEWLVRLTYNG